MGVSPLTNNTAKTTFGEDLVKSVPPLLSSRVKGKKHRTAYKYKTSPSLEASGATPSNDVDIAGVNVRGE